MIGQPVKCHLNGVLLAGRWWPNTLVVLWLFRGSRPVLLGNPIVFWFFKGGSWPPVPPLDLRVPIHYTQRPAGQIQICTSMSNIFCIYKPNLVEKNKHKHRFRLRKNFSIKLLIFTYPSVLTYVLGAKKICLFETVLLSTHNICFGWEIRK